MFNGVPHFFDDLNHSILCSTASRGHFRQIGFDVRQTRENIYFVYGMSSAAAKWRLANATRGIDAEGYSEATKKSYSCQLRVALAVIALEAFAKVMKRKWYDLSQHQELEGFDQCAQAVRGGLTEKLFDILIRNMDKEPIKIRLREFRDGADAEVISVAAAIRNSFAHGLIGANSDIIRISENLRSIVLDSIKLSCTQYTDSADRP